jgi:N-glycosylase/DNA lyase
MKEQVYTIENQDSFELKDIFECGQCFRWNKENDGSYTGVIKNCVLNVKKEENKIIFNGISNQDLKEIVIDYFDLNRDYTELKSKLSKIDEYMLESINYGVGIRILNQDFWECIISYIISANNNIPRIKKIIEAISKEYGKEVVWKNKSYYLFPTVDELSKATVEELRGLGTGFRDKRIYKTTQMIYNKEFDLEKVQNMSNTNLIREELLKLDGVGNKVADCVMLFSLKRYDVFPIDVWVRRVMNDLYIHNENEENVNKAEIQKIADEKFSNLAGLAQQYLFYWRREAK